MKLSNKSYKKFWWLLPLLIGATITFSLLTIFDRALVPTTPDNQLKLTASKGKTVKKVVPSFDKKKFSTSDPTSLWVVVNKQHALNPTNYEPSDLVTTGNAIISAKAKIDFDAMIAAALTEGVSFKIVSSYRSYVSQTAIYNNYISIYGQTEADTFSARPGYSEHQIGLSIDFGSSSGSCDLDDCFGNTSEGQWLATHASDYGFILRYPPNKQTITGYKSEPWHYRYVGRELATGMKKQSINTLEEFFGMTGGEIYKQ